MGPAGDVSHPQPPQFLRDGGHHRTSVGPFEAVQQLPQRGLVARLRQRERHIRADDLALTFRVRRQQREQVGNFLFLSWPLTYNKRWEVAGAKYRFVWRVGPIGTVPLPSKMRF